MKTWGIAKWAAIGYGVTLAMFVAMMIRKRIDGVSPDNVMANFAIFMITQVYPLVAILLVLVPYSLFTRRWRALLGGCIGNIAFFPLTMVLAIIFGFAVGLPMEAWRDGNHAIVVAVAIAYCTLAVVLTRTWIKRRRSQPATAPYSEPAARSPQG
jgi:hypothetical protein